MTVKRIIPYAGGDNLAGSKEFYVEVLGLEVAMQDPVLGLQSREEPAAQVIIPPPGMENPSRISESIWTSRQRSTRLMPTPYDAACESFTR